LGLPALRLHVHDAPRVDPAAERRPRQLGGDHRVVELDVTGDVVGEQADVVDGAAADVEAAGDRAAAPAQRPGDLAGGDAAPPLARQGRVGAVDERVERPRERVEAAGEGGRAVGGGDGSGEVEGRAPLRHLEVRDVRVVEGERELLDVDGDVVERQAPQPDHDRPGRRAGSADGAREEPGDVEAAPGLVDLDVERELAAYQRGQEVADVEPIDVDVDAGALDRGPQQRHAAPGVAGRAGVGDARAAPLQLGHDALHDQLAYRWERREEHDQRQDRQDDDGEDGCSAA